MREAVKKKRDFRFFNIWNYFKLGGGGMMCDGGCRSVSLKWIYNLDTANWLEALERYGANIGG